MKNGFRNPIPLQRRPGFFCCSLISLLPDIFRHSKNSQCRRIINTNFRIVHRGIGLPVLDDLMTKRQHEFPNWPITTVAIFGIHIPQHCLGVQRRAPPQQTGVLIDHDSNLFRVQQRVYCPVRATGKTDLTGCLLWRNSICGYGDRNRISTQQHFRGVLSSPAEKSIHRGSNIRTPFSSPPTNFLSLPGC